MRAANGEGKDEQGIYTDENVSITYAVERYIKNQNKDKIECGKQILLNRLIAQGITDRAEQQKIIDMIAEQKPGMLVNLYITDCYSSVDSNAVMKGIMEYYEIDTPLYNYTKDMVANITSTNSNMDADIQEFVDAYRANKERYIKLSELTGVPPEVLAVIHYRENTKDYLNGDFQVYLHNGQKLGEVTTIEPKGILYNDFYLAAQNAMEEKGNYIEKYHLYPETEDIVAMMCFVEVYNGLGYFNHNHVSPYNYSGTNLYVSGKYVEERTADGQIESVYHEEIVDRQVGSYLLLKAIMEE